MNQLDLQLQKEKDRLDAMMKHLQLEITKSGDIRPITKISPQSPLEILSSRMKEGKGDLTDLPATSIQPNFQTHHTLENEQYNPLRKTLSWVHKAIGP